MLTARALKLIFAGAFSSILLSISIGDAHSTPSIFQLLGLSEVESYIRQILIEIRLPRVFSAALVGLLLGAGGVISQGLFKNPLAGPSIMGGASGAGFCSDQYCVFHIQY